MGGRHPAGLPGLLLLLVAVCALVAHGQDVTLQEACEADLLTLQPCQSGHPDYVHLCCAAIRALHDNGCFCAWDSSTSMSTWTRQALASMRSTYTLCTGVQAECGEQTELQAVQEAAPRTPGQDALHHLQAWLQNLPQKLEGATHATQEHTLVLEWTQNVDGAQLAGMPTNLDVQLDIDDDDSSSLWKELTSGDMASVGQWFVRLLFGLDTEDPMDVTDDMSLLMNAIADVVNEVGTQLQGQDFSLSLEVTIEDDHKNAALNTNKMIAPFDSMIPSVDSKYYPTLWNSRPVAFLDMVHPHVPEDSTVPEPWWRRPAVLSATWLLLVVTTIASLGVVVCTALQEASSCMQERCSEWQGSTLVHVEYVQAPEEVDALTVPLLQSEMPSGRC